MALPIEDYGLIGDLHTAALVGRDGSIDWLCVPRFDSGACFAALLGDESNGCWRVAPRGGVRRVARRYRPHTLILETDFETEDGKVRLIDFMPERERYPTVVRIVRGLSGRVPMALRLVVRFDYGWIIPWVRSIGGALWAVAGPDALCLQSDVETRGEGLATVADFEVSAGEEVAFALSWHEAATRPRQPPFDPSGKLAATEKAWTEWSSRCQWEGAWCENVERSLITLQALIYQPGGGMVAAPTTSLPESLGGARNWDYRLCWLRDATFTLYALSLGGYQQEALRWRDWLLRAVAGDPAQIQVVYGVMGERRLSERELPWLPGYEGSAPVRIGNQAAEQFQLDIYGELMDAMHVARRSGVPASPQAWAVQRHVVEFVAQHWRDDDRSLWEQRGDPRPYTHSRVMAWVAIDRAVKGIERWGQDGPLDEWKRLRAEIHQEVCEKGYNPRKECFTQSFGSDQLDAALLMIPLVGFLPARDERMRRTVAAVERELATPEGFVRRYPQESDDQPGGEGVFLPCSFWLVDNLALLGEGERARALYERLLGLCNDVGLLSEEYDPRRKRLLGNFPQAFTHVGLINSAWNLDRARRGPARHRSGHEAAAKEGVHR